MNTLILDLAIKISTSIANDWMGDVWFRFYLFNDEFRNYARSYVGKQLFLDTYTFIEIRDYVRYNANIYYLFNVVHRNHKEDLPAIIYDSLKIWYKNGKRHRSQDLPAFINRNESMWYNDGLIHRDCDKPAHVYRFVQFWYINGAIHRDGDKPAVVYTNGRLEWWENGQKMKEFKPMC